MAHRFAFAVAALVLSVLMATEGCAAGVSVAPTDPPSLRVVVSPGSVDMPNGTAVDVTGATLTVDPPQTQQKTVKLHVPADYREQWENWQPWATKWRDKVIAVALKPRHDEKGTPILGGLFRQIPAESVTLTTLDGSRTFERGTDYRFHDDWGQIGAIDGRLGQVGAYEARKAPPASLKADYTLVLQRIDLLQVGPDGAVSVKQGTSRIVCPRLPEPEASHKALAGIYVAPWTMDLSPHEVRPAASRSVRDGSSLLHEHGVTEHEIFAIKADVSPVEPVNPWAVSKTLATLRDGGDARIAFMGASITLGAEARQWWDGLWTEKNKGYPSRVVTGLRERFPEATVTPIASFKGGTTTAFGLQIMQKDVIPKKPDLVLIAFGGNDVAGSHNGPPRNPAPKYKEDMRKLIKAAKDAGAEVMIVCIMQQFPWFPPAERWPDYRKVQLELVEEEGVALADVYTEWMNQAKRGTPPFTQLHNWINHPGIAGHELIADVILRFFPE